MVVDCVVEFTEVLDDFFNPVDFLSSEESLSPEFFNRVVGVRCVGVVTAGLGDALGDAATDPWAVLLRILPLPIVERVEEGARELSAMMKAICKKLSSIYSLKVFFKTKTKVWF